jgi:hypothetical protein
MFNLIVFGVIALVMLLLGYHIKYKKKANLISGYNEDLVTDVDGLCNWVGRLMMINAAIALSTGILMAYFPAKMDLALIYFVLGIVITSVFAVVGTRKFKRK